jgi:Fe2+ transport system protein FeoA
LQGEFLIVLRALDKEQIDEIAEISKRYKKEEEEEEKWRLKLEEKRIENEMKKKKLQEEIDEGMRKKLAILGFEENHVEAILDPKWGLDKTQRIVPEQARPRDEAKIKEHEEEVEEELRKRLTEFGFRENQVDAIMDPKRLSDPQIGRSSDTANSSGPTYIKISKKHLDVETLKYFGLPWGNDPKDSNFFIIYQNLDRKESEVLFEHTRKLRNRTTDELLRKDPDSKDGQGLAFVGRKDLSKEPSSANKKESL